MSLWVVRAGRSGDQQDTAVRECIVCHGWNELPDYSAVRTKDELGALSRLEFRHFLAGEYKVWHLCCISA